jgi:hypothetical protein
VVDGRNNLSAPEYSSGGKKRCNTIWNEEDDHTCFPLQCLCILSLRIELPTGVVKARFSKHEFLCRNKCFDC